MDGKWFKHNFFSESVTLNYMKYIISESRLEEVIMKFIEETFPVDEINFTNPYDEFDDGTEGEDPNRIEFYRGDYEDEDALFRWYGCDYFTSFSKARENCPMVELEDPYSNTLDGYFGDLWKKPFKDWFETNFNVQIKSVH